MRNKVVAPLQKQSFAPDIVLDVGANVGQSAREFAAAWPKATVHSFEPITASFLELRNAVTDFPNVVTHQLAMGARVERLQMLARGTSPVNRIVSEGSGADIVNVDVSTLDDFCEDRKINRVDFLKIDAEGHDLQVLVGAAGLLRRKRVEYLQVECGLSPDNRQHVPYQGFADFLFPFGYRLFGLFGLQYRLGKKALRGVGFADAVFVVES